MKNFIILFSLFNIISLSCYSRSLKIMTPNEMILEAREHIKSIKPYEAKVLHNDRKAFLLDVRSLDDYKMGYIQGAIHIPRGELELRINDLIPSRDTKLIVYSEKGRLSSLATYTLLKLGYPNTKNLAGGLEAWQQAGYPISR